MELRIQLFGAFQVWRNGALIAPAQWQRRKTQALLKVLVGQRGQVFTQDQLIECLFVGGVADKALQNLHARVSELRKVLEPTLKKGTDSRYILSVGKGRYQFNPQVACQLDTEAFLTHAKDADALSQNHAWTQAAERYRQAAALYQGPYLAEDPYEAWTVEPRRVWQSRYVRVLTQWAECLMRQGLFEQAAAQLEAALGLEPSAERVVRQLMRCHALAGQRAQVKRVYAACVQTLSQTLQVQPDRQTRALYERLLQEEGRAPGPLKAIAVLPFLQLSSREEHTYFSDGLTDDVISQLAKIHDLKVISRTTMMRYKHTTKDLQTIGRELGVGAILEGSVRTHGDQVRVSAQLIDVTTDTPLWSEHYDRRLTDIFAIQSDLACNIAQALCSKVSGVEERRIARAPTAHLEAYRCYLKGRYFWNKRKPGDLDKAIAFFEQAIACDPHYAEAYAGLADSYAILGWFDYRPARQVFPKALEAAQRALSLNEALAEAHTSLAYVTLNHRWDWQGAEKAFRRALALNPNYATAHHWYGEYLSTLRRHEQAVAALRTALALDPLSLVINTVLAWKLCFAGALKEAESQCHKALELDPQFGPGHTVLGWIYEAQGRYQDALDCFVQEIKLSGETAPSLAAVGYAYAKAGRLGKARCVLKKLLSQPQVSYFHVTTVHIALGELAEAFCCLEQAFKQRAWVLVYLNALKRFDPLRSDPRFAKLLRRIGIPS